MRPRTLSSVVDLTLAGYPQVVLFAGFLDEFYLAGTAEEQISMLEETPRLSGDPKLDALVGAVAEYLSKQFELDPVPPWASHPERFLREPWFTASVDAPGMKEYLAWSSPAEFRHRNIFTEERPLRRASMAKNRFRMSAVQSAPST